MIDGARPGFGASAASMKRGKPCTGVVRVREARAGQRERSFAEPALGQRGDCSGPPAIALHATCVHPRRVGGASARHGQVVRAAPDNRVVEDDVLPTSLVIVLATIALTLAPALVLLWAWRRGLLRDLDAQSRIIFEPRDWRLSRPWESPPEQLTREVAYGDPVPPAPGEWGGAA